MADPTETPPLETPTLPSPEALPASEYRAHREGGKSVEEIVHARPAVESEAATEETPADTRVRDEAGRFTPAPVENPAAPKAGNPRHDPRARIDELTREKSDAIRRAEAAEAKLEREAHRTGDGPTPAPVKDVPAGEFTFQPFDEWLVKNPEGSYDTYIRKSALAEFKHEQQQDATQREQVAQRQQVEAAWKPFRDREAAFRAETPDYDAVIQRSPASSLLLPPWVMEELQTSAQGPALRYYLAQHPDETAWVATLPKAAAVPYLRALLSPPAAPTVTAAAAPTTKAAPPFETVGVTASASTRSLESAAKTGDARRYRELREAGVKP